METIVPDFTVAKDGFHGKLYRSSDAAYRGKALVVFSGSDGRFALACMLAELFQSKGITAMALAYVNAPGLKDSFEHVPIEYVERAALQLGKDGYEKIGVWGISMGAELALLAGCYFPGLISCVIAASPINISTQGFYKKGEIIFYPCAAYSYRGKSLPYEAFSVPKLTKWQIIKDMIKNGDPGFYDYYEPLVKNPREDAVIPVEQIQGPILLISGGMDSMWPSKLAGDSIVKRLQEKQFAYTCQHLSYEHGSHFMVPLRLKSEKIFKAERKYKAESEAMKQDQLTKTMEFLKRW